MLWEMDIKQIITGNFQGIKQKKNTLNLTI